MENNFHQFRKNTRLRMQDNFVFIDTESNINKTEKDTQVLTFKLGCGIFWKKSINRTLKETYRKSSLFWDDLEGFMSDNYIIDKSTNCIMFAHNMEFDFRQLNGYFELFKRGYSLITHYIKSKVFILIWKKENRILHVWSTTNYVGKPLESLGKAINLPKLKVDFTKDSDDYLETYCMRDTEIIYMFIKELVEFLQQQDLSRLKATAGALSLNIFRHSFYDDKNKPIFIHDWKQAIRLERESYRGGITDCFKLGYTKESYKLDINSMYPYVMKNEFLPTKLIAYLHEGKHSNQELMNLYNKFKGMFGIIANCIVNIPKEYAYILNDFGLGKGSFAYGKNINLTLCTPELNFIEKYGKIVKIREMNVYLVKRIFRKFVRYFYGLRKQYKKEKNDVYIEFCKLILNTLYGKFGQKQVIYTAVTKKTEFVVKYSQLILLMIERTKEILGITNKDFINNIVYLGTILNECELYLINGKLHMIKQTSENSKDSFVAISSFITSYARMMLVDYILKAKRKNIFYSDTDSLFTNKDGFMNLWYHKTINKYELGKLKVEGVGFCNIFAPKFYDFNDERKAKGIRKKNSILITENTKRVIYNVESWEKSKTALKIGNIDKQIVRNTRKQINKIYDKGKTIDNIVIPYSIREIKKISVS